MKACEKPLLYLAWSGVFLAGSLGIVLPVAAQQLVPGQREPLAATPEVSADGRTQADFSDLPDSPGAALSTSQDVTKQQTAAEQLPDSAPSSFQSTHVQSPGTQSQPYSQEPVGTAVAEAPHASGVAAAEPAGVAIAPAKQRRVRTIVLRMGAIVGAGVAVGSVVALSGATSSKPPGAH